MKIAFVGQHISDAIGGAEVQVDILSRKFQEKGHSICYFIIHPKSSTYPNLPYPHLALRKPYIKSFYNALKEFRPDAVYWRAGRSKLLISAFLSRLMKIKFCFAIAHVNEVKVLHFFLFRRNLPFFWNVKQFIADMVNYIGYFFTDLTFVQSDDFMTSLPVKNKVKVYNSMETPLGSFSWDRPYIFWVGSLKKAKNPEKCLVLAENLSHLDIDILLAGKITDPDYEYFKNKNHLPPNLHYLGPMEFNDVNSAIAGSLLLFHTCAPEGFCNNFIQAWLLQKPTVTLFYDPENFITKFGLGYHSKTDIQLSTDIQYLINNPDVRNEMGRSAHETAKRLFSPENNVSLIEKSIAGLLKE